MIASFRNQGTEDVFNGDIGRAALRICPASLIRIARRKLALLNAATAVEELASPPGNRLEDLSGDRRGQHSIRINDRFRICFRWTGNGPENVEIVDYH
jgi:toxin HigB-1